MMMPLLLLLLCLAAIPLALAPSGGTPGNQGGRPRGSGQTFWWEIDAVLQFIASMVLRGVPVIFCARLLGMQGHSWERQRFYDWVHEVTGVLGIRRNLDDVDLLRFVAQQQAQNLRIGVRSIHNTLTSLGIACSRERVTWACQLLDPAAAAREFRVRQTLQRRVFVSPHPNYSWHIDTCM
eukprot:gene14794-biopygen1075